MLRPALTGATPSDWGRGTGRLFSPPLVRRVVRRPRSLSAPSPQEITDKHVTATHNLQGLAGTPGLIHSTGNKSHVRMKVWGELLAACTIWPSFLLGGLARGGEVRTQLQPITTCAVMSGACNPPGSQIKSPDQRESRQNMRCDDPQPPDVKGHGRYRVTVRLATVRIQLATGSPSDLPGQSHAPGCCRYTPRSPPRCRGWAYAG